MVLTRALLVVVLAAGCNQSLFSAGGDDAPTGDAGPDAAVPTSCPSGCIADAAGDYDGSPTGSTGVWRYLDDRRDRTWAAMTASTDGMVGADPANLITSCAARPSAPACTALPGALLVSTAGSTAAADPALELTSNARQVVQLTVRIHVPAGAVAQAVRLYRNSREDALISELAAPGTTFERALEVDALAGDRFLLALAPNAAGASDVGVHFYAAATGAAFPTACQMAVTFDAATGNAVGNPCGGGGSDFTSYMYNQDNSRSEIPPTLVPGPFPELGMAADLTLDRFFAGSGALERTGPTTIQLWVEHDAFDLPYAAFLFTDDDLDNGGGLSIDLYDQGGTPKIEMATCKDPNTVEFDLASADWPGAGWHFVRVVYDGTTVAMCIDGARVATMTPTRTSIASTFSPHLGKNVVWTPAGAYFDGRIDDLRVFSTALPCE